MCWCWCVRLLPSKSIPRQESVYILYFLFAVANAGRLIKWVNIAKGNHFPRPCHSLFYRHRPFLRIIFAAVSTSVSLVLASLSAVLIFSGMQMYRPLLASSQMATIFGGYLGSWLFILSLTVGSERAVQCDGRK